MAGSGKYFYMRLKEDFFDSEEMIVLESMPDGVLYQNILMKMYCRSLKNGGRLMLNGVIPYNPQMLASVTRQQVGTVEKALQVLQQLGLIDILDNGAIYMLDIQNFIGESSTEGDRKRKYRTCIEEEKKKIGQISGQMSAQMSGQMSPISISIYKDKDISIDTVSAEEKNDRVPYKKIMEMYNSICKSFPSIRGIEGERKKAVAARWSANPDLDTFKKIFEIAESSKFLQGHNSKKWTANFDFMMAASKFDRILEGCYNDEPRSDTSYNKSEIENHVMNKYRT